MAKHTKRRHVRRTRKHGKRRGTRRHRGGVGTPKSHKNPQTRGSVFIRAVNSAAKVITHSIGLKKGSVVPTGAIKPSGNQVAPWK